MEPCLNNKKFFNFFSENKNNKNIKEQDIRSQKIAKGLWVQKCEE